MSLPAVAADLQNQRVAALRVIANAAGFIYSGRVVSADRWPARRALCSG